MELWQIAKPFGRPAKFKSPEELWDAFIRYVEWSTNNPLTIQNTKAQRQSTLKNERSMYQQTVERPLTLGAFRLHAGIKRDWCAFRSDYSKRSQDFCRVIRAIEDAVLNQQVANAMVGNYKENLVARLNNISDTVKQEVTATASVKGMSVEEAQAFLAQIEKEI